MKKWEERKVLVVYCDYCKKEIKGSILSVTNKGEEEKHFHYYNNEKCFEKYTTKQKYYDGRKKTIV